MTTHDQETGAGAATAEAGSSSAGVEPSAPGTDTSSATVRSDISTDQAEPSTAPTESSATSTGSSTVATDSSTAGTETPAQKTLFADDELSGLRTRWEDVQAAFVDDPRDCVQKADALVSVVVEQLTTSFTEARSRLEAQWDRGEEASTEDLRLALKRYREFFERLLAV